VVKSKSKGATPRKKTPRKQASKVEEPADIFDEVFH
jgi:hypothetical protein